MPGPSTELLNDDLKTIRSDIKDSSKEVHNIVVGLARLQTEFGLAKWLLGLLLVATITGIGSEIWWASAITNRVGTLESRLDRFELRFDRLEASIAKILEQTRPKP